MLKRIVVLALALLISGVAYAGGVPYPQYEHIIIESAVGADMTKPAQHVRLVRYGFMPPGVIDCANQLNSGDVVVWDTNSADGITISASVSTTSHDATYAGVLVTSIETADSGVVDRGHKNWGYICVTGYCLARCSDNCVAGDALSVAGQADMFNRGFRTLDDFANSADIGVCLQSPTTDGLAPVILY